MLTAMSYSPDDPRPVSILIAPSGIGSHSADEVAQQLGEGILSIIRDAKIRLSPLSLPDSGLTSLAELFPGEQVTLPTTTAAGTLTEATYVLDKEQATAYIDAAQATGTDRLTPGRSDSYGVGVLVADAQSRGARRVVLNLTGCPTDDGGVGVLVALGANPLDQSGRTLPKGGTALETLADFDTAQLNIGAGAVEWVLVTDTSAPLDTDAPGMAQLAEVTGVDPATPGLGAGGGIAVAVTWLSALLHGSADNVRLIPAEQLMAGSLDTSDLINPGDFLVTTGALAPALARSAGADNVLGVVLGEGETAPEQALTVNAGESLQDAGAQLAVDYLRISTVQG